MGFTALSYPNKCKETPAFYVQIKGELCGRPLKTPICNCAAVYSDVPELFEIVFLLYKGGAFLPHIIGSVVPFIRLDDLRDVINRGVNIQKPNCSQLLQQTRAIEELITVTQQKISILKSMQKAICTEFLR